MDEKKIAYKRVLLKLSGEALSGDAGTGLEMYAIWRMGVGEP